ncbi:transcriptional regulator [Streptomyces hoynatensis]|nr:transcriptional regulator [Streptomyces hoynatensis]
MKLSFSSTSEWSEARSLATSLARYGERDVLRAFIDHGTSDDSAEVANLNYWAYWLGLDRCPRADDSFMAAASSQCWDAGGLLRALATRLSPGLACIELNVHTVWAMLAAHPRLTAADPRLSADLANRVGVLLDDGGTSSRARRELEQLHYGLRMA